jgi:hypothetical protein
MQLYCRNGQVIAWHDDGQMVPASVYGTDVVIIPAPVGFAPVYGAEAPQPDLAAYAAQRRWEIETGGITVGGAAIETDDRSKLLILGKRTKALEHPEGTTRWKVSSAPVRFEEIPNSIIIATADAVEAHVQNCFDAEADIVAGIEGGVINTIEDVDTILATIPRAY